MPSMNDMMSSCVGPAHSIACHRAMFSMSRGCLTSARVAQGWVGSGALLAELELDWLPQLQDEPFEEPDSVAPLLSGFEVAPDW